MTSTDFVELATELRTAAGQLIRKIRRESGETELTWSQSLLLSSVARRGTATASELAVENGLRTQTVWSSLSTLERRGLISRERDRSDRRNVLATLTPAAHDVLAARHEREVWLAIALERDFSAEQIDVLREAVPLLLALAAAAPVGSANDTPDD
ncbi:MarR family winged helix-turn-helix transcriptional regulator [Williamsia muralis]|nr:MarR family transcriptional regulator [Williamsia marianensis]